MYDHNCSYLHHNQILTAANLTSSQPDVAVDCIALNTWGKHKRKMVIRGIDLQESNQQQ